MAVYFAAVHERHAWRKHSHHSSLETATSGDDGAENLLRNLGRVGRTKRKDFGAVHAVFVWDDTMESARALRLAPGSTDDIQRAEVPVKALEGFTKTDGPSPAQIADWFEPPEHVVASLHPEELREGLAYLEGAAKQVLVNAYERDERARLACIAHYGPICKACDLDFEDRYGPIGTGFIHVHHEVPLASVGVEYQVDPVRDLKPVCPNCHAMLHRQEPPLPIATLRAMLRR